MPKEATSPITPCDPIDKEFLKEYIKELTIILSGEWVEEAELSSKEIRIHTPSLTLQIKVGRSWEKVLYNPTIMEPSKL
jgi:hypothetical protein